MESGLRDAVVVGGGFYGCTLALHLRVERKLDVTLVDTAPELLSRASYGNQARVHQGYHYPRSILTGLRSRVNFPRFRGEFEDCVASRFVSHYALARRFSNVTATQFLTFCDRMGAPCAPATKQVTELLDPHHIEAVYRVEECAFDAIALRTRLHRQLEEAGVELELGAEALRVARAEPGLTLLCRREQAEFRIRAHRVFNCTYAHVNRLLHDSGLGILPLDHEIAEIALIRPPAELESLAITVLCGPFFSTMPFPPRSLHSLSHVRYTPHRAWRAEPGHPFIDPYEVLESDSHESAYPLMLRDAARYLPCIAKSEYVDSIWEVKTVLPVSERDDSRPILLSESETLPGLVTVVGGKVDNVYDMLEWVA